MIKRLLSVHHKNSNLDWTLLIVRIGVSVLMFTHGIPKLMKLFGEGEIQFADPIGLGVEVSFILAIFAEFLCSILIVIGFATRLAAIPIIITMLVVILIVHSTDGFRSQELSILYLLTYIVLLILGSGKFSVDGLLSKPKK